MVRSRWIKTVLATLVSTGLVWGQQAVPTSPPKDDPTGRIITVSESGRPGQKCRVVKWWTDARGQRNLQVESLVNGEVMTIVETGAPVMMSAPADAAAEKPRSIGTLIFHWGKDRHPPAGTPVPPEVVMAGPAQKTMPVTTIVETQPEKKPGFLGRMFHHDAPPTVVTSAETKTTVMEPAKTPDKKVASAVEPAKTGDWRQSWGKTETKPDDKTQTAKATTSEPKKTESRKVEDYVNTSAEKKKPVEAKTTSLPKADTTKPDPLAEPGKFSRLPDDLKPAAKAEAPKKRELPALPPTSPPAPVTQIVSLPPSPPAATMTAPAPATTLPPVTEMTPPVRQTGAGGVPLGARSVVDSGAAQYMPVPVVTMPLQRPPTPIMATPPQPPRIAPRMVCNAPECDGGRPVVNAFTPSESIPPPPYSPLASLTSNAFSSNHGIPPNTSAPPMPVAGVFGPPPQPPLAPQLAMTPAVPPFNPYGPSVQMAMRPPAGSQNTGVAQVGYQTGAQPMPTATAAGAPQMIATLRDALYPSQRESAAEKLSGYDWKTNEAAVQALLQAAREDPAPTVRASCVHALARMKAATLPVVSAIRALKNDADARVRHEAEEALSVLAAGLSSK